MADVLFLSPPRRHDGSQYLFNNATLSLASYLHKRGQESYVAPLVGPEWPAHIEQALKDHKPRVVAVSCKWWDTIYGAVQVASKVKELAPDVKVVAGGQTATSFARDLVAKTPFDGVILGDGELPLLQYAQGNPVCNLVTKEGSLPHTYTLPRGSSDDLRLVSDLSEIADRNLLTHAGQYAPFVWTGKGCQSACLFCAGSAFGHKKLFGRTGYMYRPLDQTLHDMEALAPWTCDAFMFDFDPVTDPAKEQYYLELCKQLPKKKYHAAFFCWSLPSQEFIHMVSETFASALVSLDAQTYSEPLRYNLASRNRIKPFSSDLEILQCLETVKKLPNVEGVVYGIIGLAGEQPHDVQRAESFMSYLQDAYADSLQAMGVNLTPLTIEPDSLMDRNPEKYGVVKIRRSFEDYLEFTRTCFERSGGDIFHAPYTPEGPHPYGVYLEGDDPGRVHSDYWRLTGLIKGKSHKHEAEKAMRNFRHVDDEVHLKLKARTIHQDDWRLIMWAAGEAVRRQATTLKVDATEYCPRIPPVNLLPFGEQFAWLEAELPPILDSVKSGKLKIEIEGKKGTQWGFLEEIGTELRLNAPFA